MCTPEKIEEYNNLLKKTKGFKYADMVTDKSFSCLNPSEKSELVSFICNELLSNKAVVHQIDNNVENISKAKKDKWEVEAQLKRLKIIQAKKLRQPTQQVQEEVSEHAPAQDDDKDDSMSVASENDTSKTTNKKGGAKGKKSSAKSSKKKANATSEPPEDDNDETNMSHDTNSEAIIAKEMAEDEKLSVDEIQKKIDKTNKKLIKKRDELAFISNRVRVHDLGQDRYRRRYHHFAFAGGVYVEGLESCEPWKLEGQGMPHVDDDGRESVSLKDRKKDVEPMEVDNNGEQESSPADEDQDSADVPKVNGNKDHDKENIIKKEESDVKNEEEKDAAEVLSRLSKEILITPKLESKLDVKFMPKVTPNGEKLNLFNHTSNLNMTLNPVILNGAVTITPKDPSLVNNNNNGNITNGMVGEKPWFSILPQGNPVDHQSKNADSKDMSFVDTITPQIEALEVKLEELRNLELDKERAMIPKNSCRGWWRLSKAEVVNELDMTLNTRGIREQHLLTTFKRNLDLLHDEAKKKLPEGHVLEPPKEYEDMEWEPDTIGAPPVDEKGDWSKQVALRVDKYILEQVEALEDKVAAASMQVPGWKVSSKDDVDQRTFRPSCLYIRDQVNLNDEFGPEATNPVEEARERLLDLEQNIERRYLNAPLGFSVHANQQKISTRIVNDLDESREDANEEEEETPQADNDPNDSTNDKPEKTTSLPKGLIIWREGVRSATTAAQLAMAFYQLETSIAWHKSIMKAYCQLCHCGDNEDSLLLCDGCDKGFHTYCFKPALENIPDGDWFCFECINKATGVKHCLVCGKEDGKNQILCATCPRAYHTTCLSPALSKVRNIFVIVDETCLLT